MMLAWPRPLALPLHTITYVPLNPKFKGHVHKEGESVDHAKASLLCFAYFFLL